MKDLDRILGGATMGGIGYGLGLGLGGSMTLGAATSGVDLTNVGTGARYFLGGGMDTLTFKDGSKLHEFSDGNDILVDKNGKYVASFYSHSMP
jgi:hypothetical protein